MNRLSHIPWERNGNFENKEGGIHAMDKSNLPLGSCGNFPCKNADLNSNEILISDSQEEEQDNINTSPNHNKRERILALNSPTNTFNATSLHQKDLSYDDLSKNIDANLAEIDMETFRSEDINSILALPAIYSGHFDSVNNGEQCASVSGSLLNGLEIETSVGQRISEDEISICKDEPLFSPQREPVTYERAISVDGLDNSSSYDQDLVLTCKANKNNYTIVFEGSETQFSEDSEYHNGLRSSEVVSSTSEEVNNEHSYTSNSMIQSDLVFTTWSNLKRAHLGKKRKKFMHEISIKSKSLPNLSYQSAFLNDKVLQWAKTRGNKNSFYPDLELFPHSNLQVSRKCGYPYALSLVKLFMKYKVSSRSSVFSSEHSGSTNSLIVHSLNNINHNSLTSISKTETKEYKDNEADVTNQNYNIKNQISLENLNTNQKRQLYVDNIKILDWHPNGIESNNNTSSMKSFLPSNKLHNTSNIKDGNVVTPSGECDNSQYFEDSLIEAPILQVKNFNTMPIKEEEETDISSGDEIMKTSMSSDCNNCSSASIDAAMIKNNALDMASTTTTRQDVDQNLDRIINIFPSSKTNFPVTQTTEEGAAKIDVLDNQTQSTQTKQQNSKHCVNVDSVQLSGAELQKTAVKQTPIERCVRHSSTSREASPNSSGYVSSRHSSAEKLHRSSVGSRDVTSCKGLPPPNMKNVLLTTTKNCSTQVPVHVKDCCMQTSALTSSHPNVGFLLANSLKSDICPMDHINSKSEHAGLCPSNKQCTKEDKCIYVCFPNYSLPDLSFLNSVTSEGSNSVFLSPSKFTPCPKVLQTPITKPKSSEELDAKRLSNIKDWDSLNVLLPDDLKNLLSQMHIKDGKVDSSSSPSEPHTLSKSKSSPVKGDLSSYAESERKRIPSTALRQCSFNLRNRNVPQLSSDCFFPVTSWKSYSRDAAKARTQLPQQCACQQCMLDLNMPYDSCAPDILKISNVQAYKGKTSSCYDVCKIPNWSDFQLKNCSPSKHELSHSCSKHATQKCFSSHVSVNQTGEAPGTGSEHLLSGKHSEYSLEGNQHDVKNVAFNKMKISHKCKATGKKQHSPTRNSFDGHIYGSSRKNQCQNASYGNAKLNANRKEPAVHFDHPHLEKSQRNDCDHVNSDDFYDMEKAPQEFLVSPVQNASPYPLSPDSYQMMQNSSANGNVDFHDSLKRKTSLVENLQKATLLIFEDHSKSFKLDASCCTAFSVGQKILTFLCPAVHTILSDGLLPSVQGFFGPLPNSPWKVAEASVQLDGSRNEVQELLKHVNSEKLLTDSTYRFNAFIMGLLNFGCLEWWLGHLLSSQNLISHHYHPTALLSLLSLAASSHLRQELMELVSPLTNLSFNLDLAFETRIAAAKVQEKCTSNCCSSNKIKATEEISQNKLHNFGTYSDEPKCSSNKPSFNGDILHPSKAQLKGDMPVWPGITINPFPNAIIAKDTDQNRGMSPRKVIHTRAPESSKFESPQKTFNGVKEKTGTRHIGDFSLCSSTDSGCSSQVCQSHVISSAATDSGESESQASAKQDGQQFRKLQQKWEKITLGGEKPTTPKSTASAAPSSGSQNVAKKSVEVHAKKASRCQVRMTSNEDTPKSTKAMTVKRAVSQPPSCKQHSKIHAEAPYERKLHTPDVIASSKVAAEKKSRSSIPTLKTSKNLQSRSKIPIQKTGTRAQSSNRDSRNVS